MGIKKHRKTILLICAGIITEFFYILLFFLAPHKEQIITSSKNYNFYFYGITTCLLLSLLIYIIARHFIENKKQHLKIIIWFFIVFNFSLLFLWPPSSVDILVYITQGRIVSEYSANPYYTLYNEFPDDPFYDQAYTHFSNFPTLYGPLFIIISSILAALGSAHVWLSLFAFKLFFIILNLLSGYLIYKIFPRLEILYLYAWNPLLLFEFAANGHNDVLIIFFLALVFYFLLRKKNTIKNIILISLFLSLSVLIKYLTIVLLPVFALIVFIKNKNNIGKALQSLIIIFSTFLITTAVFFLPFFQDLRLLKMLFFHSGFLFEIGINTSPFILIILSLMSILNNFALVEHIFSIGKIAFIIFYFYIVVKIWHNRSLPAFILVTKYFWLLMLGFLLTFFGWLMPWYLTVLIMLTIIYSAATDQKKLIYTPSLFSKKFYYYLNLSIRNLFDGNSRKASEHYTIISLKGVYISHILTLYGIIFYIFLRG